MFTYTIQTVYWVQTRLGKLLLKFLSIHLSRMGEVPDPRNLAEQVKKVSLLDVLTLYRTPEAVNGEASTPGSPYMCLIVK